MYTYIGVNRYCTHTPAEENVQDEGKREREIAVYRRGIDVTAATAHGYVLCACTSCVFDFLIITLVLSVVFTLGRPSTVLYR